MNNTHGVGFLIRQDKDIIIKEIKAESERILSMDVSLKGYETKLVCAYAPTAVDDDMNIDEFYKILRGTITSRTLNQKCMVLGDFNAYPEFAKKHSCVSEKFDFSQEGEANHNVEKFIELVYSEKLSVLNTWFFQSTMKRRYTHQSFDKSKKPRVIDYILTDSLARKYVQNCRAYRTIQIHPNQDHRLVMTELVVPTDKTARFVKHKTKSQNVDKSKLSNIETRRAFKERVRDIFTSKLPTSGTTNLETNHNALIDTIKGASAEILPKQRKTKGLLSPLN